MIRLTVPDMSCGHCVKTITDSITRLDSAATVSTDLQQKTVTVQSGLPEAQIRQTLTQAGYPPAA